MPLTMRSNSPIRSSMQLPAHASRSRAGSSSRQASSWRSRSYASCASMPAAIAGLGVAHGIEQQVRDLGHRRNHDQHRPLLLFGDRMRAATRIRSADPTLVPPNFITNNSHSKTPCCQCASTSEPFETRARTIFNIASSTSLDVQAAGVQVYRVGRLRQRGFGAGAVALVALLHLARHRFRRDVAPGAASPRFGARRARRGSASRKIFTSAFGNTTVRCRGLPSPRWCSAIRRCLETMARRTPGIADALEAASDI